MNSPMPFPIKCLGDVEKVDLLKLPHFGSGIKSLDRIIQGLFEKQLIVITGKRGQGKSTFAGFILSNALDQGKNIFAYSGELPDYHFRNWLDMQIAGVHNMDSQKNSYGDYIYTLKDSAADMLSAYYSGRAYIYDNSYVPQGTEKLQTVLMKSIEYAAKELNCKVILIDNIMTAVDMLSNDPYAVQSDFVKQVKALANNLDITIILIAHPRKTKNGEELVNDDVSGSSDITNLADIVLTYSRLEKKSGHDPTENGKYQSSISVTKNRLTGRLATGNNVIKVRYSEITKRILGDDDPTDKAMCCFRKDFLPF